MALKQFPQDLYLLVLDSTDLFIGGFSSGNDLELGHIRLHMFVNGTVSTDVELTVNVYTDSGCNNLYASSTASKFSDIEGYGDNWLGTVRFDFNRQHIPSGEPFYVKVSSSNYTRNANVSYIGFICDWPLAVNQLSSASKMEVIGYELV